MLAKLRRFLDDGDPVDWQRLKVALPHQREWLEANEEIEAMLRGMMAVVTASGTNLSTTRAKVSSQFFRKLFSSGCALLPAR